MKKELLLPLLLVNFLFAYKYGSRVAGAAVYIAGGLFLGQLTLLWFPLGKVYARWLAGAAMVSIVAIAVVAGLFIPLEGLNVDRWSVITSFLDALGSGRYPYAATSHMGNPPGPMPVYFLLAWPFYALRQLSLLSAVGYVAALYWLRRYGPHATTGILLLMSSPFMYWELATRSNIFTFSVLIVWGLERFVSRPDYVRAVIVGLLLATRSVFALAYVIYFLSLLRRGAVSLPRFTSVAAIAAASFFAVFLPFILVWPTAFWRINPFIVQGSFLVPPIIIVGYFIAAFLAGLWVRPCREAAMAGGLLFGVICIYAAFHTARLGVLEAYFGSVIDISYFIFSLPLLGYHYFRTHAGGATPSPGASDLRPL